MVLLATALLASPPAARVNEQGRYPGYNAEALFCPMWWAFCLWSSYLLGLCLPAFLDHEGGADKGEKRWQRGGQYPGRASPSGWRISR
jgi:hypothetical protein